MAVLRNLGFETAGVRPGWADGWDVVEQSTAMDCADFTDALDVEDFSVGWSTSPLDTFAPSDVMAAVWDMGSLPFGSEAETFQCGWGLSGYLDEGAPGAAAGFTGSGTHESFEAGWDGDDYLEELVGILVVQAATFTGGADVEDFADGWVAAGYLDTLVGEPVTMAPFYSGASLNVESFDALDDVAVTVEAVTYYLRSPGFGVAGYVHNTPVHLLNAGDGGVIPAGLNEADIYYVLNLDADRFQVATSPDGTPEVVTGVGSGMTLMRVYPVKYWSGETKPKTF